jgi:crotonobetainyl-CoA:carnitine CoA-transferase CaiB-like acyl-CoA transferase
VEVVTGPLSGMRIVESSAFVAAPLAGMTLAQMGADVIRVDRLHFVFLDWVTFKTPSIPT